MKTLFEGFDTEVTHEPIAREPRHVLADATGQRGATAPNPENVHERTALLQGICGRSMVCVLTEDVVERRLEMGLARQRFRALHLEWDAGRQRAGHPDPQAAHDLLSKRELPEHEDVEMRIGQLPAEDRELRRELGHAARPATALRRRRRDDPVIPETQHEVVAQGRHARRVRTRSGLATARQAENGSDRFHRDRRGRRAPSRVRAGTPARRGPGGPAARRPACSPPFAADLPLRSLDRVRELERGAAARHVQRELGLAA